MNPTWAVEGHVCDMYEGWMRLSACAPHTGIRPMTGLACTNADKRKSASSAHRGPSPQSRSPGMGLKPPVCLPGSQEAPHLSLPPTMPGSLSPAQPAMQGFAPGGLAWRERAVSSSAVFPAPCLLGWGAAAWAGSETAGCGVGLRLSLPTGHRGDLLECLRNRQLRPAPTPHQALPAWEKVGRSRPASVAE